MPEDPAFSFQQMSKTDYRLGWLIMVYNNGNEKFQQAEMKLLYTDIRTSLTEILNQRGGRASCCWQAGLLHRSQLSFF